MIEPQMAHRLVEGTAELIRILARRDLGLDDDPFPRDRWKHTPKLHLGAAVASRGFDVIDAEFEGAMNGCFQIRLGVRRNLVRRHVVPLMLETHSAAAEYGHLKFGAAKASVFHGCDS